MTETVKPELMKQSGMVGLNKPFRAPVYRTYWECIRGLHNQGILGFYKGNGLRMCHLYLFAYCQAKIYNEYLDGEDAMNRDRSWSKSVLTGILISLFLHPLHQTEARFVLQNRIPNFNSYKSIFQLYREGTFGGTP